MANLLSCSPPPREPGAGKLGSALHLLQEPRPSQSAAAAATAANTADTRPLNLKPQTKASFFRMKAGKLPAAAAASCFAEASPEFSKTCFETAEKIPPQTRHSLDASTLPFALF